MMFIVDTVNKIYLNVLLKDKTEKQYDNLPLEIIKWQNVKQSIQILIITLAAMRMLKSFEDDEELAHLIFQIN